MTRTEFKQKYFPGGSAWWLWENIDKLLVSQQERIKELEAENAKLRRNEAAREEYFRPNLTDND